MARAEDGHAAQVPRVAHRAAGDVHARHAKHERGQGFGCGGPRRGLRREEGPTPRQLGRAAPVGEEAEVADADEAGWEHVEEEAVEELLGRQDHRLQAIRVSVVSPLEAYLPHLESDQPVIGDGHTPVPRQSKEWVQRPKP